MRRALAAMVLVGCGSTVPTPQPAPPVVNQAEAAPTAHRCSSVDGAEAAQVAYVEVAGVGAVKLDEEAACRALTLGAGDVFDAARVDVDVRALWATERYDDIAVRRLGSAEAVGLRFELTQVATPSRIRIEGKAGSEDAVANELALLSTLGLDNGKPVPPWRRGRAEADLRDTFLETGHLEAKVTSGYRAVDKGEELVFTVDVGPQFRIASITIDGPPKKLVDELRDALQVQKGDPVFKPALEGEGLRLTAALLDRGYIEGVIQPPQLTRQGDAEMAVRYEVKTGAVYRLGALSVTGIDKSVAAKLKLGMKTGEVLSQTKMRNAVLTLKSELEKSGMVVRDITPQSAVNTDKKTVDIVLAVDVAP